MRTKPEYTFVIDTNKYAGNFERMMCGFMTGDGGEYGYKDVDDVFHQEVGEDHPLVDFLEYRVDDNDDVPTHSPVVIWQSPLWIGDGAGGHYRKDDAESAAKALVVWRQKTIKRSEAGIARYKKSSITQEEIDRTTKHFQKQIEDAKVAAVPNYGSAYTSVGIFLQDRPTDEQIKFLKARAHKFAEFCREDSENGLPKDLVIEGFRLSWEVKIEESIDL